MTECPWCGHDPDVEEPAPRWWRAVAYVVAWVLSACAAIVAVLLAVAAVVALAGLVF